MSGYQRLIVGILAVAGIKANPRHVEAWMRVERGSLDALSPARFDSAVWSSVSVMSDATEGESEALARSMGL